jgi:hypothetical protein
MRAQASTVMRRLIVLLGVVAAVGIAANGARAGATRFSLPVEATLLCGAETVQVSGSFRVVVVESTGATVFHVTADGITGEGTSGTHYRLVGAGADIEAGVGATSVTSFHHGTLVGAGAGQPIHPLMYVFHATIEHNGEVSNVSIDVSDCVRRRGRGCSAAARRVVPAGWPLSDLGLWGDKTSQEPLGRLAPDVAE